MHRSRRCRQPGSRGSGRLLSTNSPVTERDFDVLVIGSGIAGLVAALTAAPRGRVGLVTKAAAADSVTRWAQGGVAAALGDDDSAERHFEDTIAAGRGLCDEAAVRVLVEDAPARVGDLAAWGVSFDTAPGGALALGREAAHAHNRIVHAGGDTTGRAITEALLQRLRASGAAVIEHAHVTRILADAQGRCAGVEIRRADGESAVLGAGAVVLASGGAGQLWRITTNPATATGDGVAAAYDAGAEVAGMEFVQFHPTVLAIPGAPNFLLSEAMRGEGAAVVDRSGTRFLFDSDPLGELAGRDVVARAIAARLASDPSEQVFLDCRPLGDRVAERFPTIVATCLAHGVDLRTQPVPIAPAAHYMIGGVRTDTEGATSVDGLFACGEVASTGVHGANRLASNSLIEGAVFGARAARRALHDIAERPPQPPVVQESSAAPAAASSGSTSSDMVRLREAMWTGCGLVRDDAGLRQAGAVAAEILAGCGRDSRAAVATHQAATTASLVCRAARLRTESRGAHIRTDHPTTRENWHGTLVMHNERGDRFDRHA